MKTMRCVLAVVCAMVASSVFAEDDDPYAEDKAKYQQYCVGKWDFDDASNPLKATIGDALPVAKESSGVAASSSYIEMCTGGGEHFANIAASGQLETHEGSTVFSDFSRFGGIVKVPAGYGFNLQTVLNSEVIEGGFSVRSYIYFSKEQTKGYTCFFWSGSGDGVYFCRSDGWFGGGTANYLSTVLDAGYNWGMWLEVVISRAADGTSAAYIDGTKFDIGSKGVGDFKYAFLDNDDEDGICYLASYEIFKTADVSELPSYLSAAEYGGGVEMRDPTTIYVSPTGAGTKDGTTEENAMDSICDAVQSAIAGDEIALLVGDYTLTDSLMLTVPVTMRGAGASPQDVRITVSSDLSLSSSLITLANSAACLKNLCVTNINVSGAKLVIASPGSVENCVFADNNLGTGGTVISLGNLESAVIRNSCFEGNTAAHVVDCGGAKSLIEDCRFKANHFEANGGIILKGKAFRCQFLRNVHSWNKCPIQNALVYDSLFDGNTGKPNTVWTDDNNGTRARMYNCTVRNQADCIVQNADAYQCVFDNCKGYSEHASHLYGCMLSSSTISGVIADSCFEGDARLDSETGVPQSGSMVLDAGMTTPAEWFPLAEVRTKDLNGADRVKFANPDVGCFEIQTLGALDATARMVTEPRSLELTSADGVKCQFEARVLAGAGVTVQMEWNFGDGETVSRTVTGTGEAQTLFESHTYRVGGSFDVTITLTTGEGESAVSRTIVASSLVSVTDKLSSNFYVSPEGSDANPGTSPERPKATISSLVNSVQSGSVIHVLPGEYSIDTKLTVPDAITVRGEGESPEDVVFTSQSQYGMFTLEGTGSRVEKVCFKALASSPAIEEPLVTIQAGVLQECVFTNLVATGTTGHLVSLAGGTDSIVRKTRFLKNSPGRAVCSTGTNKGVVEDCEFVGNQYSQEGLVYNSIVYRSKFINNSGGGCSLVRGSKTHDSFFTGNVGRPSTIYEGDSYNCTMIDNASGQPVVGGGTHYNNIIVQHESTANPAVVYGGANLHRCFMLESSTCDGNCTQNDCISGSESPLLENYTLKADSGLVDAGLGDETAFPESANRTTDLAGNPRIMGKRIDLGCYEFKSKSGMIIFIQ